MSPFRFSCRKCSSVGLLFWKTHAGSHDTPSSLTQIAVSQCCESIKVQTASTGRQELVETALTVIYFPPQAAQSVRRRWQLLLWASERIFFSFFFVKIIRITSRTRRRDRWSILNLQTCILLLLVATQMKSQRTGQLMLHFSFILQVFCMFKCLHSFIHSVLYLLLQN